MCGMGLDVVVPVLLLVAGYVVATGWLFTR